MLHLPREELGTLRDWVRSGYPNETCGLLLGRQENGLVEVRRVDRARNLNRERARDRYQLDPLDYLESERRASAEGMEVVGIWHSHPDHPARPSESDRSAAYEGVSYLIVSVSAQGVGELRSWRLRDEVFEEEELRA